MQAIKIFIILLAVPLLHAELIQVIQLGRHGARSPNSFEFLHDQYPEAEGQLTSLGVVQEYFLGQEMRKRYVEDLKFLSETFDSEEVVIKSSWKNRTMRSAFAFANGLYPQETGTLLENEYAEHFPIENLLPLKNKQNEIERDDIKAVKIDEDWARRSIEIITEDGDLYFHAAKNGNCPPAEGIIKELKKSHQNKEFEKYLHLALYPELASEVNNHLDRILIEPELMSLKKAKSVLDNYRCNTFHGKAHPGISEQTLKILKKLRYYYAYKIMLADDMVNAIAASKLLGEFLEYTRAAEQGKDGTPKYVFYSAHDTNLEILFRTFLSDSTIEEGEHYNIIPFSSVLSLEIHKEHDTYYAQLLFNDEPQLMKWCNSHKCPLSQFHKILEHHIVPNLEEFCNVGRAVTEVPDCSGDSICY
jgi:hypothetical protein